VLSIRVYSRKSQLTRTSRPPQASGFTHLVLANNQLDDTSVVDIVAALRYCGAAEDSAVRWRPSATKWLAR
jgi:hypothetical protein